MRNIGIEPLQQVEACLAPGNQVDEADERDAELVCNSLSGKVSIREESADVEAAALRRLDRRKEMVAAVQRSVEKGDLPRSGLESSQKGVDAAVKDYVLAVTRGALIQMATTEFESMGGSSLRGGPVVERFAGDGSFSAKDWNRVATAYLKKFGRSLPVSANGETAVHRALGFDHRSRIDVALSPDAVEGLWLRRYLQANDIPYLAFRHSVPGKATAAHIHVGPPSHRLQKSD